VVFAVAFIGSVIFSAADIGSVAWLKAGGIAGFAAVLTLIKGYAARYIGNPSSPSLLHNDAGPIVRRPGVPPGPFSVLITYDEITGRLDIGDVTGSTADPPLIGS
jgi:hypothetical protein